MKPLKELGNVAVIGAGITGLSVARLLREKYVSSVVFERSLSVGGLVHCEHIDGYLYHLVGGHVFNTKSPRVSGWFWSLFDRDAEFHRLTRNAKILFKSQLISYPIENYLYELQPAFASQIIDEVVALSVQSLSRRHNSLKDYFIATFGPTLYSAYFEPYNLKIWQRDLALIPLNWLEGKLPMPSPAEILKSNILRLGETQMVHSTFYYPKIGGSQFVADRIAEGTTIRLDCGNLTVSKSADGLDWTINGENFDAIIYTGDIRHLERVLPETEPTLTNIKKLRTRGITNVLCECEQTDISWLYISDPAFKCNRIIYTGTFSSENSPPGKMSCVVEFPFGTDSASIESDISKLPGSLRIIANNHVRDAYVIHELSTGAEVCEIKSTLANQNVFLLGRFAEWQYYNVDTAIAAAMTLVDQITEPT